MEKESKGTLLESETSDALSLDAEKLQ